MTGRYEVGTGQLKIGESEAGLSTADCWSERDLKSLNIRTIVNCFLKAQTVERGVSHDREHVLVKIRRCFCQVVGLKWIPDNLQHFWSMKTSVMNDTKTKTTDSDAFYLRIVHMLRWQRCRLGRLYVTWCTITAS